MIRNGIKTKADIKRTHDEMARFLIELCAYSDSAWGSSRTADTKRRYNKARRLIRRAGFKYEPKK